MFGLQHMIEGVRDYRHVRPASVNVIEGDVRERCSAPCKYFDLLTDLIFRGVLHSLYVLLYYVHILVWALSFWAPCPVSLCFRMCSPSTPFGFGFFVLSCTIWVLSFGSLGYLHCLCIDR